MQAIIFELGRYLVESESGNGFYLCDVIDGWCDCPRFRIFVASLREEDTCKHLIRARHQWLVDFPPDVRQAILQQQKVK